MDVNPAARGMYGYIRAELLAKSIYDLMESAARLINAEKVASIVLSNSPDYLLQTTSFTSQW
jgi:hypothetical protein